MLDLSILANQKIFHQERVVWDEHASNSRTGGIFHEVGNGQEVCSETVVVCILRVFVGRKGHGLPSQVGETCGFEFTE